MDDLLSVRNLCKTYSTFTLRDVSFALEPGYIMGFVGRNGAGKTTTLKSIVNLVHADSGDIEVFGRDFRSNEIACKQRMGVMFGGVTYYPKQRLTSIVGVIRRFYDNWDDASFTGLINRFHLNLNKKVDELSAGMQVKFALALALSHRAELLVLDEPTSGLDPVSRDEVLELFQEFIEDGGRSILFSTQITSDLDKCADFVTYIKEGEIIASADKETFLDSYRVVSGSHAQLTDDLAAALIGLKRTQVGFTGLVLTADTGRFPDLVSSPADIESVMIYVERGVSHEEPSV